MTDEIMLLLVILFVPILMIVAFLIAHLISHIDDRKEQETLDAISAKYAARKIADDKYHAEIRAEIAQYSAETDRISAQLDAIKNCPKWAKMKQEMAQEYSAMIKGRNQFNAMMGR
jgi:mannitol-specific phosphotransferase system IIBC component